MTDNTQTSGALLIYHHYLKTNAPTIMEHVNSFGNYSRYKIWAVNTEIGFLKNLYKHNFSVIILHYTLFGVWPIKIFGKYYEYLKANSHVPKIAFFQDDYTACVQRFKFIDELKIDTVYTLLEPKEHHHTYYSHTNCKKVVHTLAGYIDNSLSVLSDSIYKPDCERTVDIGYRARPLPYYLGKGGQEKTFIANEFVRRIDTSKFTIDIKTGEKDRIYGKQWYYFIANCRAMIGVEAGSTIVDLESKVRPACEKYLQKHPDASFNDVFDAILKPWEGNINYRVISPRIFECAALKVCMILFEGSYSGIIKPMVHYIPLKKDFSNFESVMQIFGDINERKRLTDNAYRDLIASGNYSYEHFINEFDNQLEKMGIAPNISKEEIQKVTNSLSTNTLIRTIITIISPKLKFLLKSILKPRKTIRKIYRKAKYNYSN